MSAVDDDRGTVIVISGAGTIGTAVVEAYVRRDIAATPACRLDGSARERVELP
jgi:hypothetical protein